MINSNISTLNLYLTQQYGWTAAQNTAFVNQIAVYRQSGQNIEQQLASMQNKAYYNAYMQFDELIDATIS